MPGFEFQAIIFYLCETKKFPHAPSLTTVMRCTSQIFSKLLLGNKPLEEVLEPEQKNFAETYWNKEIKLGHHVDGPEVCILPVIHFASDKNRSVFYLKIINDEINAWAKVDDTFYYNRVAILVPGQVWYKRLSSYLEKEGIPHCRIGDNKDAMVLDLRVHAQSYEWPVVIAFAFKHYGFGGLTCVPFSRAVIRLVIAWIP